MIKRIPTGPDERVLGLRISVSIEREDLNAVRKAFEDKLRCSEDLISALGSCCEGWAESLENSIRSGPRIAVRPVGLWRGRGF